MPWKETCTMKERVDFIKARKHRLFRTLTCVDGSVNPNAINASVVKVPMTLNGFGLIPGSDTRPGLAYWHPP